MESRIEGRLTTAGLARVKNHFMTESFKKPDGGVRRRRGILVCKAGHKQMYLHGSVTDQRSSSGDEMMRWFSTALISISRWLASGG